MDKFSFLLFFLITIFLLQGCNSSSQYKNEILKEELRKDFNESKRIIPLESAIKTIEVDSENFQIFKSDIPDNEQIKRIKILGAELNDVIALITEATNQNIIFQHKQNNYNNNNYNNNNYNNNNYNNNNTLRKTGLTGRATEAINRISDYEITTSKVYISASDIGFGRLLKKTVGNKLSISYDDNTYYLGSTRTVTLKIPSLSGLSSQIQKTLSSLGAINTVNDSITSTITFSAKEKEYQDIMKYLVILRNNLYVIEYDIEIYDVALKDNYSLGINWSLLPTNSDRTVGLSSSASSSFGSVGATTTASNLSAIFNSTLMSGSMIAEALSQFGKVESIQRPKLLGIAGTDVTLVDGQEEPYIKTLTSTAVGDYGIKTSTESATALSGLKIILNSNIMDETIITNVDIEISDITGYSDFNVGDATYSQPRIHKKNIKNTIRVQPGVPIVISGLFRNKIDKGYKGIPGIANTSARILGGSEHEGITKSEMVIIVTPRVIKYVMK
ncbi:MAG: type II and III secretion system protein [Sulfurimonas sp.]|nr:type II and III secretion system protein [Sulfurimonas sp.]